MMAVNVYHACIVGIFTTRLRRLFVCGPRRAKNNSSRAAFRCAMARLKSEPLLKESDEVYEVQALAGNVNLAGIVPGHRVAKESATDV